MYDFEYQRPQTLDEAVRLMADGAQALAGGQSLLASMKLRLAGPSMLVDLARVPGLQSIDLDGDALRIGAMVAHQDVSRHPAVAMHLPALSQLAGGIGDRQVRARGTIGGSVANNDPAACYPSAVLGCGATIVTDRREIAADDYFTGLFATDLQPGELITSVRFPLPRRAAYEKMRQAASRFSLIGVFVAVFDDGVRVAVTGGGHGVFRHRAAEQALSHRFDPAALAGVSVEPAAVAGDLHAGADYRAHLVSVLCERAVARMC